MPQCKFRADASYVGLRYQLDMFPSWLQSDPWQLLVTEIYSCRGSTLACDIQMLFLDNYSSYPARAHHDESKSCSDQKQGAHSRCDALMLMCLRVHVFLVNAGNMADRRHNRSTCIR